MLSKEDYLGYLKEMFGIENQMAVFYGHLQARIDDPEIKRLLQKLCSDEAEHERLVGALISLVQNKFITP
ncbi:MAG: hypothetical protein PHG31_04190 [Candidatus Omnitrophica bacterium]|nr:hypothetical protein [Candidatus Omnitrophota bacterium]